MNKPLGFIENGVKYYIFATNKSVTVIGMSNKFTVQAQEATFKEALTKAKKVFAEEAPLD